MSDAVYAGLPRFDAGTAAGAPRTPGSWMKPLDVAVSGHRPPKEILAADVIAEPPPQPLDFKKIEAALAALGPRLDKIERDAQAHALEAVQSLAARLFPELSKRFLADEIGHHLPSVIPASAAVVEIRASEPIADKLRELVERSPSLAQRCTITPLVADGQGRVDVSWQTGGVSFDFDGLLAASLSHMNSHPSVTKE